MEKERNVDYVLGRIESTLDAILKTLSEDRLADAQYRTDIRKELREYGERLGKLEAKVSSSAEDVAEMKPKVTHLEERALMSKGAQHLAIILGKAAHVISAAVGGAIVLILDRLVFHK